MVLVLCTSSDDAVYMYQVLRKYLKEFQLLSRHVCLLKFPKGHNSVKTVGRVMVLVLCILSDDTLYAFQRVLR